VGKLGLILGSGAAGLDPAGAVVVERHGEEGYALPHEIDHVGNLRRLADAGCDRVLGVASVGSLHPQLAPGTLVCPHDFIALDQPPLTTLSGRAAHRVPGFDREWRQRVVATLGARVALRDGGVYWQVTGPRLETPAEVRLIAQHADVIGMTVGTECIIAGELGLAYAALCLVDNYANGVLDAELTLTDLLASQREHRPQLASVLGEAVAALG
jgi:5'-methylthioadenosine phosphorylase